MADATSGEEMWHPKRARDIWAIAPTAHPGARLLREASDRLDTANGDIQACGRAADAAAGARGSGLPVELEPHARIIEAAARLQAGQTQVAAQLLADSWRDFPDVAALPALLGVAHAALNEGDAAVRTMLAALVSEDPDESLVTHRRLLTGMMSWLHRRAHHDPG